MTRDSTLWTVLLISGVLGYLAGHFELLGLPMIWQSRIELMSGLLGFVAGYLKMSPLALSDTNEMATRHADMTINPLKQPGDSGIFHPGDMSPATLSDALAREQEKQVTP